MRINLQSRAVTLSSRVQAIRDEVAASLGLSDDTDDARYNREYARQSARVDALVMTRYAVACKVDGPCGTLLRSAGRASFHSLAPTRSKDGTLRQVHGADGHPPTDAAAIDARIADAYRDGLSQANQLALAFAE